MIARRRVLSLLVASTFGVRPAFAQNSKLPRRVGIQIEQSPEISGHMVEAFKNEMARLGWMEGRDVVYIYRWARGDRKILDQLAAELVALKPDLILAPATHGVRAVKRATREIPVVFALPPDPVGDGLVESLARPGGNVTGASTVSNDLGAKRLQLLKDCVPALSHAAVLSDPKTVYNRTYLEIIQRASVQLGIELNVVNASTEAEIEAVFGQLSRQRPGGILVMESPFFHSRRTMIVSQIVAIAIPAVYPNDAYEHVGGLMVYTAYWPERYRKAAVYADKILKGAKPHELPVDLPTQFQLIVNLKTAKAIGLAIPQSVLVRADRVIE